MLLATGELRFVITFYAMIINDSTISTKNVPWPKFSKVTNGVGFLCFYVFSLKYLKEGPGFQKMLSIAFLQIIHLPLKTFRACHFQVMVDAAYW